jgi:hypothetical protein
MQPFKTVAGLQKFSRSVPAFLLLFSVGNYRENDTTFFTQKKQYTVSRIGCLLFILAFSFFASAQSIGSTISFKGTDGRTYTGVIKEVNGNKYKIKYDNYDYEAWAEASQFTVLTTNTTTANIGSRVSFPGVDGKTYTGVITETQGNQYKVKYDGYDFEAWLQPNQFTVMAANKTTTIAQADQPSKNGGWRVGDKVEAYDMYKAKWYNGTVTIILTDRNPLQWRVTFDDPKEHTFEYLSLTAEQIRARGTKAAVFAVNSRVDAYYSSNTPKGRATVTEVKGGGRYKVHYDGCGDYRDEEVDWSQLKPQSTVASNHPDITAVFGKWAMFVYSYPNTVIRGDNIYREYGTGAKAPPLQINPDGSYVWYDEYNKPPVKGTWATHAKITGITMGTEAYNGIILKDSHGVLWKIHKDRDDHIEARTMCSGTTQGGTRIQ